MGSVGRWWKVAVAGGCPVGTWSLESETLLAVAADPCDLFGERRIRDQGLADFPQDVVELRSNDSDRFGDVGGRVDGGPNSSCVAATVDGE